MNNYDDIVYGKMTKDQALEKLTKLKDERKMQAEEFYKIGDYKTATNLILTAGAYKHAIAIVSAIEVQDG